MKNTIEHLIVENLSFGYNPDRLVLDDISFEIAKGHYMAILGSSGSGKSTLLRILANILPQFSVHFIKGSISIFGKDSLNYLNTGKLAFMFQEPSLMPNLNVRQNIGFPLRLRGGNIDHSFIKDLIKTVGLEDDQEKLPSELSGGMKTRVALARAFVTKPELLLLDEPFSALDISWRYELYSYLEKIKERFNTTVILVTHDIQEAVLLANKVLVLSSHGLIMKEQFFRQPNNRYFDFKYTNEVLSREHSAILGLQTDILIDSIRGKITLDEAIQVLGYIDKRINDGTEDNPYIFSKLVAIRKFVYKSEINNYLLKFWNGSNSTNFKMELLWCMLDNPNLSIEIHMEIYNFIMDYWDYFVKKSIREQYFRTEELINQTQARFDSDKYPPSKDWLYLTYLKAMTKNTLFEKEASDFIEEYFKQSNNVNYLQFIKPLIDNKRILEIEK